jgi:hypothetical protein
MKTLLATTLLASLCLTARNVGAQVNVYDVSPRLNTTLGNITTYGYADRTNSLTPKELRVNSYFFGDYGDPYYDQDPGFRALPAQSGFTPSGLPDGSYLSFDVMSDLQYWNGTGNVVTFGNVPAGETIQMYVPPSPTNPFVTMVGTGGGPYPRSGFPIAQSVDGTTGSAGGGSNPGYFHQHLWSELQAPSGTPADGIYLYELRVKLLESDQQTPYPGVAPSLPFFVLFDNNESLPQYQLAQDWVQTNLVPFGDFNRDHTTDVSDIQAMMDALKDLKAYKTNNQLTNFDLVAFGDVNQDGVVNNLDLQALSVYLANGGTGDTGFGSGSLTAVPEPQTFSLLIIGLLAFARVAHSSRLSLLAGCRVCSASTAISKFEPITSHGKS